MTYEEYKTNNTNKKKNNKWIKKLLNKLFTIVIFTMSLIIISNYSSSFRNFLIEDVLTKSMDFSKINNLISNFTEIFNHEETTEMVIKEEKKSSEKYLDGIKYFVPENEPVILNKSGIVTFIGDKEGYNHTVIVQQSDGYYAWYGNIKETVKLYDYIESGNIIGRASGEYYYVLYKDDKPITNES